MKVSRCARIGATAVLATLVLSGTAWAIAPITTAGPFDFVPCPISYELNFEGLLRPLEITSGLDQGGTSHCAVNFTGSAGSGGGSWLTHFDTVPPNSFNAFQGLCMRADVLINKFNNAKGGGLVALLQTSPGSKGLFLLLINNGNSDRLTLNTIDPDDGTIAQLASVPLGSGIVENAWYQLDLKVTAQNNTGFLLVEAKVRSHTDPANPGSPPDGQIGSTLTFGPNNQLHTLDLNQLGDVGMAAWAKSATVNTSITNFLAIAPAFSPLGTCEGPS